MFLRHLIPCGRRSCVCQKDLFRLHVTIPLDETEAEKAKEKIEQRKKDYKMCYGVYQVMKASHDGQKRKWGIKD